MPVVLNYGFYVWKCSIVSNWTGQCLLIASVCLFVWKIFLFFFRNFLTFLSKIVTLVTFTHKGLLFEYSLCSVVAKQMCFMCNAWLYKLCSFSVRRDVLISNANNFGWLFEKTFWVLWACPAMTTINDGINL